MTVRVRFAPSPTGYLHVGNARAALYNYLFSKGRGGTFILRGDDTDRERSDELYQEDIYAGLRWLGLDWDEGLEVGGPHAPYRQSMRLDRYRDVAASLVAEGLAYHSFETDAQLEAFREEMRSTGKTPAYDGRYRIDPDHAERLVAAGERAPIRFAVPRPGVTTFDDLVRGQVSFDHVQVDDFVILRSDGTPTYHLASAVDDVDFEITHVVRGEDLLSSTPKHILLSEALGVEPPVFAHLALLMGPDGKKLSKRHGDTSLRAYRLGGYLPEAMDNYLALLGWSPGPDVTVVSMEEMIERFDLSDVTKSAAIFDVEKLQWLNGLYIRDLGVEKFASAVLPLVEDGLGRSLSDEERSTLSEIAPLVQERARLLTEVPEQVRFLFADVAVDDDTWAKVTANESASTALAGAIERLGSLESWDAGAIERSLRAMLEEDGLSARSGLQPLRVAISGSTVSPPLFESLAALGRERSMERLREASARMS
ncbi:MAG TPA: glutamate--tRNA ligase [Acidimicrobiia bacterium]